MLQYAKTNLFSYFIHFNSVITKYSNIWCTLRKEEQKVLREENEWFLLVLWQTFSELPSNIFKQKSVLEEIKIMKKKKNEIK